MLTRKVVAVFTLLTLSLRGNAREIAFAVNAHFLVTFGCIYAHRLLRPQYGTSELNAKELSKFLLISRKFRGRVQLKASL